MNTSHQFSRRRFLVLTALAGAVAVGMDALRAVAAFAADAAGWPADAFKQKSEADAAKTLYGKTFEPSDKVKLDAPEIAENGAVVPISVSTTCWRRPTRFRKAPIRRFPTG
jgi:sulfur-oxidizing protein SoxY